MKQALTRVPVWVWAGAAVAVVAVLILVITSVAAQHQREQRFLDALDSDPTTTVGELPDEQLLGTLRLNCKAISEGQTLDDELRDALGNASYMHSVSGVSEAEYIANVRALYLASAVSC